MKTIINSSALSALALAMSSSTTMATEFNTSFLQGTTEIPSILRDGVTYPSGQYYVDVKLNGKNTTRMALTISQDAETSDMLCLSPEWLQTAGIFLFRKHTRTPLIRFVVVMNWDARSTLRSTLI